MINYIPDTIYFFNKNDMNSNTVKPVYKAHPRGRKNTGPYEQMTYMYIQKEHLKHSVLAIID